MKKIVFVIVLFLAFAIDGNSQQRPKGAVLLGGSLSANRSEPAIWDFEGSIIAGLFPLKNFAVGAELSYRVSIFQESHVTSVNGASVFARYYLPFLKPFFAQAGFGNFFGFSMVKENEWFWYPKIGVDFNITPSVMLELSASPIFPVHSASYITSNLSFLILLNNNADVK